MCLMPTNGWELLINQVYLMWMSCLSVGPRDVESFFAAKEENFRIFMEKKERFVFSIKTGLLFYCIFPFNIPKSFFVFILIEDKKPC